MIEKLNAINIISTAGLSEENKIFLFGKLFGGLDGHLTVHGSLSRFFTHIALVGIYLMAVDDGIFDQTILHQVVELLVAEGVGQRRASEIVADAHTVSR